MATSLLPSTWPVIDYQVEGRTIIVRLDDPQGIRTVAHTFEREPDDEDVKHAISAALSRAVLPMSVGERSWTRRHRTPFGEGLHARHARTSHLVASSLPLGPAPGRARLAGHDRLAESRCRRRVATRPTDAPRQPVRRVGRQPGVGSRRPTPGRSGLMTPPPLTASERLDRRLAPYAPVACPLLDCGADLYVNVTAAIPIVRSSTATDLADISNAVTTGWEVVCTEGHVILLPVDDGADAHVFGVPYDPEDAPPEADDIERLARLTGWEAAR